MKSSNRVLLVSLLCLLLVVIFGVPPAMAQVSEEGGSGLIRVQRALTSGTGQWSFGFFGRYFRQELQTDADEKIHNFWTNMNATWAITDELEVTGTIPAIGWLRIRENQTVGSLEEESFDEFAFGDVSAKLKMSLPVFTPRVRIAAEGFVTFPTGEDDTIEYPTIGSGTRYASPFTSDTYSYGVRGLFSISTQRTSIWPMLIHLNGGIRISDDDQELFYHSYPSPIIGIPEGIDYTNKLMDLGVGIEFPFFSHLNFFGELHTEQLIDADDLIKAKENPIYGGGGIRIPFAGKSEFTFAGMYRFSDDDDETAFDPDDSFPEWQALVGVSFSAGLYGGKEPARQRPTTPPPPQVQAQPTPEPEPEPESEDFFAVVEPEPVPEEPVVEEETEVVTQPVTPAVPETVYVQQAPVKEEPKPGMPETGKPVPGGTPPQTINNPMVVVNVGSMPGYFPQQPMQFIDEQGNVHNLRPQYPTTMGPVYGQQYVGGTPEQMMAQQPAAAGDTTVAQAQAQPAAAPQQQPSQPAQPQQPATAQQPAETAQPTTSAQQQMAATQAAPPDSAGDADFDGIINARDKCPYAGETYNGFMDDDGCPDQAPKDFNANQMYQDTDGDGIADYTDKCVNIAEDWDGFEDHDGCPDLDNDQDGIPDKVDQCPNQPETFNGVTDADGCPEEGAATSTGTEEEAEKEAEDMIVNPDIDVAVDTDKDGIPDRFDRCPKQAEDLDGYEDADGCPDLDNDQDGILDKDDDCPNIAENFNDYEDKDGCPDVSKEEKKLLEKDADADGIPNDRDDCPTMAEDWDGYEDNDGCPDLDNDADGIPDEDDDCPTAAETFNNYQDDDGCPDQKDIQIKRPDMKPPTQDTGSQMVPDQEEPAEPTEPAEEQPTQTDQGQLTPEEPAPAEEPAQMEEPQPVMPPANLFAGKYVYFKSGSSDFTDASRAIVDMVVTEMKRYPKLNVEVAGYADSSGPEELNRTLSEERAVIVKDALVDKGISETRLTAKGFGEEDPIASNDTEEGKQKNRRVEFHIVK